MQKYNIKSENNLKKVKPTTIHHLIGVEPRRKITCIINNFE